MSLHFHCQDLDLPALGNSGVDYYVGNCHKWLCAPRGAALLWAKQGLRWRIASAGDGSDDTGGSGGSTTSGNSNSSNSSYSSSIVSYPNLRPAIISHGYGDGAWSAFAWDGCRDYAAVLSIPPLLRFWGFDADGADGSSTDTNDSNLKNYGSLDAGSGGGGGGGDTSSGGDNLESSGGVGRARALAYNRTLLRDACQLLQEKWAGEGGGFGLSPHSFQGPMALVALPLTTWRSPSGRSVIEADEEAVATSADAKRVQVVLEGKLGPCDFRESEHVRIKGFSF